MVSTESGASMRVTPSQKVSDSSPAEAIQRVSERLNTLQKKFTDLVSARAQFLYNERIRQGIPGHAHTDWVEAEKQICGELGQAAGIQGTLELAATEASLVTA